MAERLKHIGLDVALKALGEAYPGIEITVGFPGWA
jgi:hypothetical protein